MTSKSQKHRINTCAVQSNEKRKKGTYISFIHSYNVYRSVNLVEYILAKIGSKLDNNALNMISINSSLEFAINPLKCIDQKNNNCFKWITQLNSIDTYHIFINKKLKIPAGVLNWSYKTNLLPDQILESISLAFQCTRSTKARHFQYKLCNYSLATGEFLCNYQVKDDFHCTK